MREVAQSSVATLRNIVMEELTYNGASSADRLARLYGVTRAQIRSVVALLADEGLVQSGPDGRLMAVVN